MRTTIRMNEELARRAKRYAARTNRTFTQVVEDAVSQLLAAERQQTPRKRIVLPTVGDPKRRIAGEQVSAAVERMYEEEAAHLLKLAHAPARR